METIKDKLLIYIRGKSFIVKDGYKYNNDDLAAVFDNIADNIEQHLLCPEEISNMSHMIEGSDTNLLFSNSNSFLKRFNIVELSRVSGVGYAVLRNLILFLTEMGYSLSEGEEAFFRQKYGEWHWSRLKESIDEVRKKGIIMAGRKKQP